MDSHKEKGNLLSGLTFDEFLGKVFALEQGEANQCFTNLFKIMKHIDAHEKKHGRPAQYERALRKLKTINKEKERKMRIEKASQIDVAGGFYVHNFVLVAEGGWKEVVEADLKEMVNKDSPFDGTIYIIDPSRVKELADKIGQQISKKEIKNFYRRDPFITGSPADPLEWSEHRQGMFRCEFCARTIWHGSGSAGIEMKGWTEYCPYCGAVYSYLHQIDTADRSHSYCLESLDGGSNAEVVVVTLIKERGDDQTLGNPPPITDNVLNQFREWYPGVEIRRRGEGLKEIFVYCSSSKCDWLGEWAEERGTCPLCSEPVFYTDGRGGVFYHKSNLPLSIQETFPPGSFLYCLEDQDEEDREEGEVRIVVLNSRGIQESLSTRTGLFYKEKGEVIEPFKILIK